MPLTHINRDELQAVLTHLDQAMYNHTQWYNSLIRTLICHLPPDKHNTSSKSYKECLFGQWYYNSAPKKLKDHPGFVAVGDAHRRMHQLTAHLLLTQEAGKAIDPLDYDNFANALERMRLEMTSLKHETEMALYTRDPLTGAINRADMLPALRELHEMVKRQTHVCSIVMLDLDLFKNINDKFGHPAGDMVLIAIVHYISEHLRPYDKLFRYGGEEFLICMQQTEVDECYERIEVLREGLAHLPIELGNGKVAKITVSFGITGLDPGVPIEECIDRADKALLIAKKSGRNCTKVWTFEM